MQKRGQATLFIIIGVILVAIVAIATLYSRGAILQEIRKSGMTAEAEKPVEKEIVQALQNCIDEKAEEAVILAGLQGGYINIPEDQIPTGPGNQFSNALTVTGSMRVPYWTYEAANGIQKSQMPNLKTVQEQLSEHVKKQIAPCAPSVASLYDIDSDEGQIEVDAQVKDETVIFAINYPVTIQSKDLRVTIEEAVSVVNAPLGRMLRYAKDLNENKETFLEDRTIDMLVLYEELPYSGTEFTCSTKLWTKPKVTEDFKNIAAENIQNIRLKGTENRAENDYFNWNAISANRLRASFLYSQNWPTQMEIEPSEGQLLKGDELNQEVGNEAAAFLNSLFCLVNYHFIYNIKYPVLVSLTDKRTEFTLQYATQVIIKNNQPRENKVQLDDIALEPEICQDKNSRATVSALQRPGLEPLEGVEIKYKCANTVCPIGKTNDKGELTASFPQCYNGFVIASKSGLLTEKQQFSTNSEKEISLLMDAIREVPFEIVVIEEGAERSLNADEQATIQLTARGKDFTTSASHEQKTIQLVPGRYQIKSTLMQASPFEISFPKQTVEHCAKEPIAILGILGFTKERCVKTEIPPASLPQAVIGGATTPWELEGTDLITASKITFYIPAEKVPSNYDELAEIYNKIQTAAGKTPSIE